MINNYNRIYSEIKSEAERVEREYGVPTDIFTELVMEIVNIEDMHQTKKRPKIKQDIKNMVVQTVRAHAQNREEQPC